MHSFNGVIDISPHKLGMSFDLPKKARMAVRAECYLFLIPGGVALARVFDVFTIQLWYAVPILPIGMGIYYLAWKFLVGLLNEEMGIA